jgi:uncharacterized protein YyaL (SSP411 family)
LDASGGTVARLIEAARILGDRERLVRATAFFGGLEEFRTLDDVVHSVAPGVTPRSYLGDYLAYSDAALQQFLATGDPQAFDQGLAVLRRALFLYGRKAKGVYTLSQPNDSPLSPQNVASPEIVDNLGESCTAKLLRLCTDYGRLLGGTGRDLTRAAEDALSRFAPIAPALGQYAGGFYCSALRLEERRFAVVVGANAVEGALKLGSQCPATLVAPATGSVHAPGSKPGVYVLDGDAVHGPMNPARAAEMLLAD